MKPAKDRLFLILVSLVMVLVVLGFVGTIQITSLTKNYTDSLVNSYAIAGSEPVRKIEYAVKYGKPLANFYGMTEILSETKADFPEILDIQVILPDGQVAYALTKKAAGTASPRDVTDYAFGQAGWTGGSLVSSGNRHILLSLVDRNQTQIGALDLILDNRSLQDQIGNYLRVSLKYLLLVTVLTVILLLVSFRFLPIFATNGHVMVRTVMLILVSILALGQIILGITHYNQYKQFYLDTARSNTAKVVKVVQRDINLVIGKGVPVSELYGIESWLDSIVKSVPEIESMYITDKRGNVFYKTKNLTLMQEELIDPLYNYNLPLASDPTGLKGQVNLVLSKSFMQSQLREIALDALTVLITSFMFMTEGIIALALWLQSRQKSLRRRRPAPVPQPLADLDPAGVPSQPQMIRPVAFTFFFIFSMMVAFVPIVMQSLISQNQAGLASGFQTSLPSSLEALGNILATLVTGYVLQKQGWRPPFLAGLLIIAGGSLLSGFALNGVWFILARLVTGVGYGFSWMAMRGYVTQAESPEAQTRGFSALNSGIMSGSLCGVAIGSILIERTGFRFVFILTAAMMIVMAAVFSWQTRFHANRPDQPGSQPASGTGVSGIVVLTRQSFSDLVFHPQSLMYLLLIILPATLGATFLNYYFPAIAGQLNISAANIGRAFLLNGLFVIFLGPLFARTTSNPGIVHRRVLVANLIYAAALLVFGIWVNAWSIVIALLLLGFGDSYGLAAQSSYYLGLDASRKAGGGVAMAGFSVFYKLGAMLGPLLFGALMAYGAGLGGLAVGLAIAVAAICFSLFQPAVDRRAAATALAAGAANREDS